MLFVKKKNYFFIDLNNVEEIIIVPFKFLELYIKNHKKENNTIFYFLYNTYPFKKTSGNPIDYNFEILEIIFKEYITY